VRREEQIARKRGYRGHDGILVDEGATLGDLNAFGDVDTRVLATDHVLRHGKETPDAEDRQRERQEARQGRPGGSPPEPQAEAAGSRGANRDRDVHGQQPLEAVLPRRGQREHDRQRHGQARHDGPEQPFLGGQRRAAVAVEPRQAVDHGAGQPPDHEKGKERHGSQNWK
jgi:hypothetical protein